MLEINENYNLEAFSFDIVCINNNFHIKLKNTKEKFPLYKGPSNLNIKNIIKLDLSHCKLFELDNNLGSLPLKNLNISHNQFAEVPNCIIKGLPQLEDLNMSNNGILKFDNEPACCCKLKVLNLSYNKCITLPLWIQTVNTMNLKEFYYSCNIIGNTSKSEYKKVASYRLEKAVFCSAKIDRVNIDFIKSIRTLKYLDLSNEGFYLNSFSLECLFEKNDWINTLRVLILNNLDISFLPDAISKLTSVTELSLSKNNLYYLPDNIGDLNHLESLDISFNHIWCLPSTFKNLTNLKKLKCDNNSLCRIEEIYNLPKLVILDLYQNELNNFVNTPNIDFIDLEQNVFDTKDFSGYIAKKDSYRNKNGLLNRLDGPLEESFIQEESCSDKFSYDSDNEYQHREVETDTSESWDEVKIKTNPDITSSDEEWDGYFQYPAYKNESTSKFDPDCYELYKDYPEA
nr:protein lap1-like [Onthophagus taurus]